MIKLNAIDSTLHVIAARTLEGIASRATHPPEERAREALPLPIVGKRIEKLLLASKSDPNV